MKLKESEAFSNKIVYGRDVQQLPKLMLMKNKVSSLQITNLNNWKRLMPPFEVENNLKTKPKFHFFFVKMNNFAPSQYRVENMIVYLQLKVWYCRRILI